MVTDAIARRGGEIRNPTNRVGGDVLDEHGKRPESRNRPACKVERATNHHADAVDRSLHATTPERHGRR